MNTTYCSYLESPLGDLLALGDGTFLTGLYLPNPKHGPGASNHWQRADGPFAALREQMIEYFAGQRTEFDVPLRMAGTPFQQQVWKELAKIPFGVTISYAELARRIGRPKAVRAVGAANGRNPISIIVPCHRVIGSGGSLVGYGGGLENKRWLLDFEARVGDSAQSSSNVTRSPSIAISSGKS